jgi:AcrR family transcriptional regulator
MQHLSYTAAVNPDDPRARRTRERLRAAALELAGERELSAITMSLIARRAAINRATVYAHYPDLDALVADAMDDAIGRLARAAALCPLQAPRDAPPPPLLDLFTEVEAGAVLYRRMLSERGSARFARRMQHRLAAGLAERFAQGRRPPGAADVPLDLHAGYLAGALCGVITTWISADPPVPAADAALATWRLLRV